MQHCCKCDIFATMNAIDILNTHKLKRTSCREGIIDVLISSASPLSDNEIRERLPGNYDRTTFYRSFITLEESKILHKIVVDNQVIKYALDNHVSHKKEHAHFYCNECHEVQCLEEVAVNTIPMPEGYSVDEKEVILKGTCPNCK